MCMFQLDESINQEFDVIVEAAKAIHAKGKLFFLNPFKTSST